MKRNLLVFFSMCFIGMASVIAQDAPPENWFTKDPVQDKVPGTSMEKVYQTLLKNKKSVPVIVAVIDGGVDGEHEDLKDIMWVNPKEIPGNQIDDDKNGYVDDIHGWNFIGGKDGKNVGGDNLEITRLYAAWKPRFEKADRSKLDKQSQKQYDQWLEMGEVINGELEEAKGAVTKYAEMRDKFIEAKKVITTKLGKENYTKEDLNAMEVGEDKVLKEQVELIKMGMARGFNEDDLGDAVKHFTNTMEFNYNMELNTRTIVGDNYNDVNEKHYGNNDIKGPDGFHGTHVAGIIGAIRNNGKGMNGVADNVRIMGVRVVPDGDERDKDVANGIRYAVDNGAKVINMSFGKKYSWNKKVVEDAVAYAEAHDVLLVHAAGNDGRNTNEFDNYPNKLYVTRPGKNAKNWIEVGALNWRLDEKIVAPFSNYGKKNVDVMAPGMAIYSCAPDNQYKNAQGTSMASPVVAGVAAAIRSYYPALTAAQVKEIIMKSSSKQKNKVKRPGREEAMIKFSDLCISSGIINAYEAFKKAEKTKGKNKTVVTNPSRT